MTSAPLAFQSAREVAEAISFKTLPIDRLLASASILYGEFFKEKANGKKREINPPKPPLNEFQHSLKFFLRGRIRWLPCVHGGIEGRSIVTNARPHLNKHMVAKLDIEDFFPSVTLAMVRDAFQNLGCGPDAAEALAALTTYKGKLPQGAPTSTLLGNLVLDPVDRRLQSIAKRNKLTYTRYVDDVTLSGNTDLRSYRSALIQSIEAHGFRVARGVKLDFVPRHRTQVVTGLVVNQKLRPSSEFIRELKLTIRRCWGVNEGLNKVAEEEGESPVTLLRMLRGKINHVRNVDRKLGRELRALLVPIWEQ